MTRWSNRTEQPGRWRIAYAPFAAGPRHPGSVARGGAPSSPRQARPRASFAVLYGFAEIATPIFEFTEVFARPIGETTDIVAKEMYTFKDRGGEEVTLAAREHRGGRARGPVEWAGSERAAQIFL